MAAADYLSMRASVTERERSVEVLKTSFAAGRLTKAELDLRVEQVLLARYFGELMTLTADLPVGPFGRLPAHPPTPAFPRVSRLAAAALVCAIAGPLTQASRPSQRSSSGSWHAIRSTGQASGDSPARRRR